MGLVVPIVADLVLASSTYWPTLLLGVGLWGVHMGMTQGLLWDQLGASSTFLAGAAFSVVALMGLVWRHKAMAGRAGDGQPA